MPGGNKYFDPLPEPQNTRKNTELLAAKGRKRRKRFNRGFRGWTQIFNAEARSTQRNAKKFNRWGETPSRQPAKLLPKATEATRPENSGRSSFTSFASVKKARGESATSGKAGGLNVGRRLKAAVLRTSNAQLEFQRFSALRFHCIAPPHDLSAIGRQWPASVFAPHRPATGRVPRHLAGLSACSSSDIPGTVKLGESSQQSWEVSRSTKTPPTCFRTVFD